MKKRLSLSLLLQRVQRLGPELGGVFAYADLCNLIASGSALKNKRSIRRLVRDGILFKIQRGFYTTQHPDLWVLACRIKKNAYISMDSILAKHGLIGTVPAQAVSAVGAGIKKQTVETPFGVIRYFTIKQELVFGTQPTKNGVIVADREKAALDMLYFHTKGARFVVDPLKEIDFKKLNGPKLRKYLRQYQNPKFVSFVKGQIHEVA